MGMIRGGKRQTGVIKVETKTEETATETKAETTTPTETPTETPVVTTTPTETPAVTTTPTETPVVTTEEKKVIEPTIELPKKQKVSYKDRIEKMKFMLTGKNYQFIDKPVPLQETEAEDTVEPEEVINEVIEEAVELVDSLEEEPSNDSTDFDFESSDFVEEVENGFELNEEYEDQYEGVLYETIPQFDEDNFERKTLKVKRLDENAILPTRSHPNDAGFDLYALEYNKIDSPYGHTVRTGIAVDVPQGYGLFIWDRSGFSRNKGLKVVGGVIDSGYRGEILVSMFNVTGSPVEFGKGQRIAQAVLMPILTPEIEEVEEFEGVTERDTQGFGSTGE